MLLKVFFGGGSQSDAPSQSSPAPSGASQSDTSTGDNTVTPADGTQPDTVENYTREETDDGTYGPMPPAQADAGEPAAGTAEDDVPTETGNGTALEDGASQPVGETDAAEPVPAAEADQPGDEVVAEQPVSSGPALSVEEERETGGEPVAEAPIAHADKSGSAQTSGATTGVRDFVTPLLAELQAISQRSTTKVADDISASQRRAAANVHDQMIRQMLDQISANGGGVSAMQLFKSGDAEKTQSLPARWYAEA